jgi:hypothetical protein
MDRWMDPEPLSLADLRHEISGTRSQEVAKQQKGKKA